MALSTFVKEFFGRVQLVMKSSSASQIDVLAETDGTPKISNYGKASGTLTAFKVEATGELDFINHGKQSSGTIGAIRLNANNQQQVEIIEGSFIQTDPVLIPSAEGLLWNPGTTSATTYKVMFNIVNSTSSSVSGVNVGQDIGAGGSLSAVEYWIQGQIIPGNGYSGWLGPFIMPGDDRIRGVAGTNNVLAIHWNIKQVA